MVLIRTKDNYLARSPRKKTDRRYVSFRVDPVEYGRFRKILAQHDLDGTTFFNHVIRSVLAEVDAEQQGAPARE